MTPLFVGFDTSNYTTSVSVFSPDGGGEIVFNRKIPLPVGDGERGLRQSEAVFSHIKAAPAVLSELREAVFESRGSRVAAVAYSGTPRSVDGSYMPCFLVGEALAAAFSAPLGVSPFRVSHQDGHVMAAVFSASREGGADENVFFSGPFISFHVSGGTFEMLYVSPSLLPDRVFDVRKVGGTLDASAGQIIDRTGVRMGLRFPCGEELDRLALSCDPAPRTDRVSVHGLDCNRSGLENRAEKMIADGEPRERVAAYTLDFVARTVEALTKRAREEFGELPVLYAGGVMASRFIKRRLGDSGFFASPAFSSDNAAGVAVLAYLLDKKNFH